MTVKDFKQINNLIATSGQPTLDELKDIAELGYDTIINLSVPGSNLAIPHEGEIAIKNGMNYVHIPVLWQSPSSEQFKLFRSIMDSLRGKKVWIHCVGNVIAAYFVYTYLMMSPNLHNVKDAKSIIDMSTVNENWSKFITHNISEVN